MTALSRTCRSDLLFAAGTVAVAGLLFVAHSRGSEHAGMTAFMGRFHPLAVHLPIGVCVLVGLLEALSISPALRVRADPALAIILRLALVSVVIAFALGLMLAGGGGYPERLLRLHQRLAFGTVVASAVSVVMWSMHSERRVSRLAHRLAVASTLTLLGIGAHLGGSMTHGERYLVQYAPAFVKRWIGDSARPVAERARGALPASDPLVFDDVVLPILKRRCGECHGIETAKGQLRLDTFAGVMMGGKTGLAVEVGDAGRSLLMRRIAAPISEDEHMPPEGKGQLTAEEVELLGLWIDGGASSATKVRDLLVPDGARRLLLEAARHSSQHDRLESTGATAPEATTAPASAAAHSKGEERSSDEAVFHDRIAPVLVAKCGRCHGPGKQKGKLRTDSLGALLLGGESGPAIVLGAPDRGTLLARIRLPHDDDRHMPPTWAPQLDASEVRLLAQWLAGGVAAPSRNAASFARTPTSEEPAAGASRTDPATSSFRPNPTETGGLGSASQPVRLFEVVQPILVERCGGCHGGAYPSGGLAVGDRDTLVAKSYVLPGQPDASPLFLRLTLPLEDDEHMPPQNAPQPSRAEIEVVRMWIERGAGVSDVVASSELPLEVRGLTGTPSPAAPSSHQEQEERAEGSGATLKESRSHVRGGCAGCAVNGSDIPERLTAGLGPMFLMLLVLRRRTQSRRS